MTDAGASTRLSDVLREETAVSARLLAALQAEHGALLAGDAGVLESRVAEKRQHLAALESLIGRRDRLLAESGAGRGAEALRRYMERASEGERSELGALWQALRESTERCRRQNETNGAVAARNQRHVRQVLAVLRGRAPEPDDYGPGGDRHAPPSGTPLAKA